MLARRAKTDRAVVFEEDGRRPPIFQDAARKFRCVRFENRAEISADLRAFIPIEPEPAEPVVDRLRRFGRVARLIRILDAQDESAAGVTREEPVEKRGARAADVEKAGGRRRKANADSENSYDCHPERKRRTSQIITRDPEARLNYSMKRFARRGAEHVDRVADWFSRSGVRREQHSNAFDQIKAEISNLVET